MFFFKKIVALLVYPVSLCLEILLIGLFLLWFTRRQKAGRIVVSIGVVLLAGLSYGMISDIALKRLEYRYFPVGNVLKVSDIKLVIVLGAGHTSDPRLPVTSQISSTSLARLVEGIRIHNELPGSKLILSGGAAFGSIPVARVMAEVGIALGVDDRDMVLEVDSKDTKDQARLIKEIVGRERFFLVTSASHMARSMALFQKSGMHPIPAPTEYLIKERKKNNPAMFFPSSDRLARAERAFHEYMGLAWAKLRGQT